MRYRLMLLGLAVPALLAWHIVSGRMQTRASEMPPQAQENRA